MTDLLDETLARWNDRLAVASSGMLELAELDTYRRLTGDDGFIKIAFTGETKTNLEPVLSTIPILWLQLAALTDQLDRAKALRGTSARWLVPEKVVRQIDDLLNVESIAVEALGSASFQQDSQSAASGTSNLSSECEKLWSAQRLLDSITKWCETIKKTVLSVEVLWSILPGEITTRQQELEETERLAASLNEEIDTTSILENLLSLREKIESDPFGVRITLAGRIDRPISEIKARLEDLDRKHKQLRGDLKRAHQTMVNLKETRNQALAAYLKCQGKIADPQGLQLPLAMEKIEDIDAWLSTLESTLSDGQWKAVIVGLQKWSRAAEQMLSEECTVLAHNQAPLEQREELKGKLSALQSKAKARINIGATNDSGLHEIAVAAEKLLHSNQTPLDQADTMVTKYETMLRDLLKHVHEG
ncbi:hypothetical protein BH10CYA1_BH10CYA1_46500 [soil metagenome]